MKHSQIVVCAEWDDEAGVWVATSEDIQGLALEAPTLEGLKERVLPAIQDLIEVNGLESDLAEIPVRIRSESLVGRLATCQ